MDLDQLRANLFSRQFIMTLGGVIVMGGVLAYQGMGGGMALRRPSTQASDAKETPKKDDGRFTPKANQALLFIPPNCASCQSIETYLASRRQPLARVYVSASAETQAKYKELGGGGDAIMLMGKSVIRGFNKKEIDMAIARYALHKLNTTKPAGWEAF